MRLKLQLDDGAYAPDRAHELDAGWDLKTPKDFVIYPHDDVAIDTGVHIEIPGGYVGLLLPKSGLNIKKDTKGFGVIDAGYTESIVVKLENTGKDQHSFKAGDKIIQIVFIPIAKVEGFDQVDEISGGERGDNGFGSTGR